VFGENVEIHYGAEVSVKPIGLYTSKYIQLLFILLYLQIDRVSKLEADEQSDI